MAHHVKVKRHVNLASVLIADMERPLVSLLIEDQHTNPSPEQHRLEHILWHVTLFALGDRVMDLFKYKVTLAISRLRWSGRSSEPNVGDSARRSDLPDTLFNPCRQRDVVDEATFHGYSPTICTHPAVPFLQMCSTPFKTSQAHNQGSGFLESVSEPWAAILFAEQGSNPDSSLAFSQGFSSMRVQLTFRIAIESRSVCRTACRSVCQPAIS